MGSPRICYQGSVFLITYSFLKGDMFIVHNELEDGWMWVTNLRTDEQGLIVEDLVAEVVSCFKQIIQYIMITIVQNRNLTFSNSE